MSANSEAREQWIALKAEMLKRMDAINDATEWQSVEPAWWLEMRRTADRLRDPTP
jgi:hypothetical protein